MEQSDVIRFGLILAVQAEIEGMKATNEGQKLNNYPMTYGEEHFQEKAEELRNISYCPEQQL